MTNRLLIANVDEPSSQWGVVDLPDLPGGGCGGVVWFGHRLYVASDNGQLLNFTPVDAQIS